MPHQLAPLMHFIKPLTLSWQITLLAISSVSAAPPNILVIVSDDHGYADVGFHGCKDIPTPHLDRLAREGLECTNGHVSHPYCSPSRAGLMTGRYQQRFGHENNPFFDPSDHREGLPVSETLLPEHLLKAGYTTGWIGKWHLGAAPEFHPQKRGFTETFGFIGGGHHYQNWKIQPSTEYNVPIERNGTPVEVTQHLTTAFGNEASDFIHRHSRNPWFLYLAFNAPHTPHEPTAERLAQFSSIPDPKRRKYAAQVSLLDDAIGVTLAALRDTDQEQRTLVFFFSDNGGPIGDASNGSTNTPLRGGKGMVFEGGVRVPFLVKWPDHLAAAKTYHQPVSSLDVFATTLAAAGIPMPTDKTYDSVNLLPFLNGKLPGPPHPRLFWRSGQNLAVIDGNNKLVYQKGFPKQLFHLDTDLAETTDLVNSEPDNVTHLDDILSTWNKQLIPPAFPGLGAKRPANNKETK